MYSQESQLFKDTHFIFFSAVVVVEKMEELYSLHLKNMKSSKTINKKKLPVSVASCSFRLMNNSQNWQY